MKTPMRRYASIQSNCNYDQWERNKVFNRDLYALNKKDFFSFIMQASCHYRLEQFITDEVISLIECFFTKNSNTGVLFDLREMKMICLGCLSIILKLNEYRALASSLIVSISSTGSSSTVPGITLFELIVLREFNHDIIGRPNNGLRLLYSLMRVNNYFIKKQDCIVKVITCFSRGLMLSIWTYFQKILSFLSNMFNSNY